MIRKLTSSSGLRSRKAAIGAPDERIGNSKIRMLPNPSGLNTNYQLGALVKLF